MYDELVKDLRENHDKYFARDMQAADAIEELNAIREEQKAQIITMAAENMPRWIPVTERLPNIGEDVLCFCRAGISFVLAWDGIHWHEGSDRYYMRSFVTHWMPLPKTPQPPKEET